LLGNEYEGATLRGWTRKAKQCLTVSKWLKTPSDGSIHNIYGIIFDIFKDRDGWSLDKDVF
jgi:hypothetical protein